MKFYTGAEESLALSVFLVLGDVRDFGGKDCDKGAFKYKLQPWCWLYGENSCTRLVRRIAPY